MKAIDQKNRARMRQIEVLLADPDHRISRVVRHVLEHFGFRNIHTVRDGAEALDTLRHKPIDLVITEWGMDSLSGIELVKQVRYDPHFPNRDIPIIMLTGRSELHHVQQARDHGITEFVVKPFSAKTLSQRLVQVIDNPRPFVIAPGFVGPDRRRKVTTEGIEDKRASANGIPANAIKRGDKTIFTVNNQEVVIQAPDFSLKRIIGSDIKAEDIFNEQTLAQAQSVIMNMKDEFIEWIKSDITRLEEAYQQLQSNVADQGARKELTDISLLIKSQSGTFGYDFATSVAKLLHDFVAAIDAITPPILMVIRKHIDTLYVTFQQEIVGNGPEINDQIVKGLRLLAKRYVKNL